MPESYAEIEAHIEQALHKLHACEKPNVAAVAPEFQVPATRLRLMEWTLSSLSGGYHNETRDAKKEGRTLKTNGRGSVG
jgi:hypothetical protein